MAHAWSYNQIILLGHVGKNKPVVRRCKGKNPTDYAFFTLATTQKFSRGQQKTTWHNIQCWGDRWAAWVKKYIRPGHTLFIKGQMDTRVRTDPEDGKKIYDTFVRAEEIIFVCSEDSKSKKEAEEETEEEEEEEEEEQPQKEDQDDGMF